MSMRSRKEERGSKLERQHAGTYLALSFEALRDETNAITTEKGYIKKSLW
jgi:hypothetical protein